MDTTGRGLINFWGYVAEKGLMKPNTASVYRSACSQILGIEAGWETLDMRALDVPALLKRFENKRHSDFKPESLDVYKRRFVLAHRNFLEYVEDPGHWKPTAKTRNRRKSDPAVPQEPEEAIPSAPKTESKPGDDLIQYPFPLANYGTAWLRLPRELSRSDVRRICAFVTALGVDGSEDQGS